MRDFTAMAVQLDQHRAEHPTGTHRLPTPFIWQDPTACPAARGSMGGTFCANRSP